MMRVTTKVTITDREGVDLTVEREVEAMVPDEPVTWSLFARHGMKTVSDENVADLGRLLGEDAVVFEKYTRRLWQRPL